MPEYLSFSAAARLIGVSKQRVEQLLRDSKAKFPRPFQPLPGAKRLFAADELRAWIERRRASY